MPLVPILSVLASFYLMLNLPTTTWMRFFVWMVVGLVVYFAYGYGQLRHSRPANRGSDVDLRERRARRRCRRRRLDGSAGGEEPVEHPHAELQRVQRHPLVDAVEHAGEVEVGRQPQRREAEAADAEQR